MGYLHSRGIIHKDLKTKNIFLENGKVVITDFGLLNITRLCRGNRYILLNCLWSSCGGLSWNGLVSTTQLCMFSCTCSAKETGWQFQLDGSVIWHQKSPAAYEHQMISTPMTASRSPKPQTSMHSGKRRCCGSPWKKSFDRPSYCSIDTLERCGTSSCVANGLSKGSHRKPLSGKSVKAWSNLWPISRLHEM